jgi:hypothetical protein
MRRRNNREKDRRKKERVSEEKRNLTSELLLNNGVFISNTFQKREKERKGMRVEKEREANREKTKNKEQKEKIEVKFFTSGFFIQPYNKKTEKKKKEGGLADLWLSLNPLVPSLSHSSLLQKKTTDN